MNEMGLGILNINRAIRAQRQEPNIYTKEILKIN
jgi:hypothetical protein